MLKSIYLSMLIILCGLLISCGASKDSTSDLGNKPKFDTLAVIGDEAISLKEYEDFYVKNNGGAEAVQKANDESKKQFLDLLVKYKLKVKESYRLGYQNDPEVKKEIAEYKRSLAIPYIIDKEVTEPNLKLWYERKKKNLQIAAILLRVNWSLPEDTLQKYNLCKSIIDSLNKGGNFYDLAVRHTELRNTLSDSGILGYITAGQTVRDFEDAIFSLSPGKFSQYPVKIPVGYIITKLIDSEKRTGISSGRKFAHILFQFTKTTKEDSIIVLKKVDEALAKIKNGESFEKLVNEYSDDAETKAKGGLIGSFERDPRLNNPPEFWKAAFNLKPGEVSAPVKTWMGVHLIKYIETEPFPTYEAARELLKEDYKALKYESDYQKFIASAKAKCRLSINLDVMNQFYTKLDTNKNTNSPGWDSTVTPEFGKATLVTVSEGPVSIDQALEMIRNNQELKGISFTPSGFKNLIDKICEILALNYRADKIDADYPEFKDVMKEYIDGLLLFRAEQNFVWNKLVISDSSLKEYYNAHQDLFQFPDRVNISEIYVAKDSLANSLYKMLTDSSDQVSKGKKIKKPKKPVVKPTFEELAEKYIAREGYKEKKGVWGLLSESDNELARKGMSMTVGSISQPFAFESGYSIIKVNSKEPARGKKYEECGPELSSKFQEYETKRLEQKWVDSLRKTFLVKLFEEKIKNAFSNTKSN